MAENRKVGNVGLSMPVINPSNVPKEKMTPEKVKEWIASLPMADTGSAAKNLFMTLNEYNRTYIEPMERFKLIELYRLTNRTICTTLKKHYIEQNAPLTEHKLLIANLRQTLLSEMADNYKLILEELHNKPNHTDEEKKIITASICRVLYYLNTVLLCRYQLYSDIPKDIWKEIHLLYKYGLARNILSDQMGCELSFNGTTSIIGSYTRIILLSATDPYQWRQRDQYSINKAIDFWAVYPTIYEYAQIPDKKTGIYIIDLDKDEPPIAYSFKHDAITKTSIALDVAKNVKHLKHLLLKIHNNEEQARIEHPNDPEFSVTIPTLVKLIKIWSQLITRNAQRFPITAKIRVAFGITAAHYFVNNKVEFITHPSNLLLGPNQSHSSTATHSSLELPTFEIEEEKQSGYIPIDTFAVEINREHYYQIYDYIIDNISPNGFCIKIDDGSIPPFQAGEIMVFKNPADAESAPWSLGSVRWIRSPATRVFQIGIELIAPYAKAAGIQMVRNGQPAGFLLRCMVLPEAPDLNAPSVLITPTLPLRSSNVLIYMGDKIIKANLIKELDATGTYHQYTYTTKENMEIVEPNKEESGNAKVDLPDANADVNTEFDDIWGDL
jgi:hypothetical protein